MLEKKLMLRNKSKNYSEMVQDMLWSKEKQIAVKKTKSEMRMRVRVLSQARSVVDSLQDSAGKSTDIPYRTRHDHT